jgi:ABC-type transport system substrate-binding protein
MAALHALDRQQFADLIVGPDGGQPNGLVHWPLEGFALPQEELASLQPHDPARARELIRDATGEDSIQLDLIYPVTDDEFLDQHVPVFVEQMKDAGFEFKERALDLGSWITSYESIDYTSSLSLNQVYETAEIPLDFHSAAGPLATNVFATGVGALHPEIEEAIAASKRVTDPSAQMQAVQDVQRLIYEKGPASLPIMGWLNYTLYQPRVRNVPQGLGSTGLYLTNEIWLDGSE